jgi:hypothetical protein
MYIHTIPRTYEIAADRKETSMRECRGNETSDEKVHLEAVVVQGRRA